MKTTKDIGTVEGPVLVFGGVYSNLQALEQLMEIAKAKGIAPSNIICTGDIVGYCAQPEECLQRIRDWGIHSILGNVEIQLRDGEDDCGCNFDDGSRCDLFSRQWYPYAKKQLSASSLAYLHQLPDHIIFQYAAKKTSVVHGSFFKTAGYIFQSTAWEEKEQNFVAADSSIILGGHCGLPFNDTQNEYYWLNAGVIGMPANDGTTRVWYMVLNDEGGFSYEHHAFEYDHQKANELMLQHQLPPQYAATLLSGLWDNCEILPEPETAAQGARLQPSRF